MCKIFKKNNLPYFILIFFSIILIGMGILNHYFFRTVTFDYGIYNYAFWDYSHFRISKVPLFNRTFLQDHFSFTLFYFVPVYWLLNWLTGTYTLILIQNSMVVIAGWYSFKLIQSKSQNIWLSSGVMLYYFVLLGRYSSFLSDVNLAVISSCFIPVFLYYFEVKKYKIATAIFILALLSRENIPLWFIFIFAVLLIEHWKEKKAVFFVVGGISLSLLYFLLLFKVFIPSIENPDFGYVLFNYSALGSSPGEALIFMLKNPIESIKLFFVNHLDNPMYDGVKAEFYWVYLISGGFILFFRPKYFIWFIPVVAQKVLNDSYIRWGIGTYYAIEVVTLLPLSVFLVLSSLKTNILRNSLIGIVCIATLGMTIYKLDRVNNKIGWLAESSKIKPYSESFYEAKFNIKKVNKLLKTIPPKAGVSASNTIVPHLAQRKDIYYFPHVASAEYIAINLQEDNYLHSKEINEEERQKYLNSPEWEIIEKEFPVILLKRLNSPKKVPSQNKSVWNMSDTLSCNFENIDYSRKHILFSDSTKADTLLHLTDDFSRSQANSIQLSKTDAYSHSYKIQDLDKIGNIQVKCWYYSTEGKGFIVAQGKNIYQTSGRLEETEEPEWKKLALNIYPSFNQETSELSIYLWNPSEKPAYFDDLEIIINYK